MKSRKTYTQPQPPKACRAQRTAQSALQQLYFCMSPLLFIRWVVRPRTIHGHQNPSQQRPKGLQQPIRLSCQVDDIFPAFMGAELLVQNFVEVENDNTGCGCRSAPEELSQKEGESVDLNPNAQCNLTSGHVTGVYVYISNKYVTRF